MRAIVQRVIESKVEVNNFIVGQIQRGLLILVGVGKDDSENDVEWLAQKIVHLRIFSDDFGKMNKNILDVIDAHLLIVSQFTLYGDVQKGNRPSFTKAASGADAKKLYELFIQKCEYLSGKKAQAGIFGADMKVHLINDGPVTFFLDSKL